MKQDIINAQISNAMTLNMYQRQMLSLAENVFNFKNLPNFIDVSYLNKTLVRTGAIAFFYDEVLDQVIALDYEPLGHLDIYGRPKKIQVFSRFGSYRRELNPDEYVIMYDNNARYPIYIDIIQYASRIARDERIMDINISQQKTPRIWQVPENKVTTLKNLLNNIDSNNESVMGYKTLQTDDINAVLQPAPFVADKIQEQKEKTWNEFLRVIGIANTNFQKKERNIRDEVTLSQGGTIASRYSRFNPREKAVKEINEKFGLYLDNPIEVEYYDGLPTTLQDFEDEGVDDDV